jgi:DNA-binding HxlR family transcriptional regulator
MAFELEGHDSTRGVHLRSGRRFAVVDGKWKPLILWELQGGAKRFNALHRSLPGVSQKMLTQHLKELQRHGVVHRESYHDSTAPGGVLDDTVREEAAGSPCAAE